MIASHDRGSRPLDWGYPQAERNMLRRLILGCAVPVAAASIFVGAASTAQSFARKEGRLAFDRSYDSRGDSSIYTVNPDGSGLVRLTDPNGGEGEYDGEDPAWSPDGKRIAYDSLNDGVIYVMNSNGAKKRRLMEGLRPRWSPDGKRIVFEGFEALRFGIINVDGPLRLRRLQIGRDASEPDWSPDGKTIAFSDTTPGFPARCQIYVVNASGPPRVRRLTPIRRNLCYEGPRWSPDGRELLYSQTSEPSGLYIMQADGGKPRKVISGDSGGYIWSPDGREIAYVSGHAISIIDVRTQEQRTIRVKGLGRGRGVYGGIDWRSLSRSG
jgi:Tol biopolymer transport system component